jgi:ribosomal protein L6P/L9E
MSRVGKLPVAIPAGVDVSFNAGQISVKGTGGALQLTTMQASSALLLPMNPVKQMP